MAPIFGSADLAAPPHSARPIPVSVSHPTIFPIFTHIDEKGPLLILRRFILLVSRVTGGDTHHYTIEDL